MKRAHTQLISSGRLVASLILAMVVLKLLNGEWVSLQTVMLTLSVVWGLLLVFVLIVSTIIRNKCTSSGRVQTLRRISMLRAYIVGAATSIVYYNINHLMLYKTAPLFFTHMASILIAMFLTHIICEYASGMEHRFNPQQDAISFNPSRFDILWLVLEITLLCQFFGWTGIS